MQTATPMLRQYQQIKALHKDCILFFRLGDFYEMFYDDARTASKILDLVLTSRGKGTANHVPMCGIPYHAADGYIARLIKAGLKVAICEQVEDPAQAKGIVKRDVIRVITSGTYLDENSADARYLLALTLNNDISGLAFIDPATGTIRANEYTDPGRIIEVINRLPVFECVYPLGQEEPVKKLFRHPLLRMRNITLSPHDDWCFNPDIARKTLCEHLATHNLRGFGIEDMSKAVASAGALLEYLRQMNRQPLRHIDRIALYADDQNVYLSPAATYGLELENLFTTINHTLTALGKRRLREWLYHPLIRPEAILQRQAAVTLLKDESDLMRKIKTVLAPLPDIEKNLSRLSCGYTHARDILSLRNALNIIPEVKQALGPLSGKNTLFALEDLPALRQLLDKAVNPDMPVSNPDGKVIRKGYHAGLDELKNIQENGRQWLKDFQAREARASGIHSLKVGYNKVFGYYIEITKTNLKNVPENYIRKQTLVNGERFITPELKEFEEKNLTAQEKILKIEREILEDLRESILNNSPALHCFCQSIARIDAIYSLSLIAQWPEYIAPTVNDGDLLEIQAGRHPFVERHVTESFVPNDTHLDSSDNHLIILTGPNMAGKSTYIRQIALLVILAQIGSYIPASKATIGVVDKIFTRIGAHDDILRGQSTFMVEMNETADILNNLSDRSLVILDEIGRGTSTFDGLSLAWSLAEYLQRTKARTLFATHFHELTALAGEHAGVKNYNVAVKEWKGEVIFLHKIVAGSSDDSYGIYVAKLAGIPGGVIERARKILTQLEMRSNIKEHLTGQSALDQQLSFFTRDPDPMTEQIKETIRGMDVNNLTPVQALTKLQELKELID